MPAFQELRTTALLVALHMYILNYKLQVKFKPEVFFNFAIIFQVSFENSYKSFLLFKP